MGPGHGDPGMFDPSGKRGKTIEKRREEHKARRGVKGAKVPAYKREEYIPEEGYDIARDEGKVKSSKDKKDATSYPPSEEVKKTQKKNDGPSAYERVKEKYKGQIMDCLLYTSPSPRD